MAMSGETLTLPSFAKINLRLEVIGKRSDGFHDLCTIFQTVSLRDTITFAALNEGDVLTCSDPAVPTAENNLIIRAAQALRERYRITKGMRVHLEKQIPSPGGLGGGSSNAAVTLLALRRLWDISASDAELHDIAAELGSDVPFFLVGGTALGIGRGTELSELPDFKCESMLLVTPDVDVSTREAFNGLNVQSLTNPESKRILQICRFEAESRGFAHSAMKNDFEESVFTQHPEVRRVKETLISLGAGQALLSGSGASVFGLFDRKETRQAAMKALDNEINWRKFAVATISRSKYREALEQVY